MPLWLIHHPPGIFTDPESKRSLAADITQYYTKVGLPAFYVGVQFVQLPASDIFVGAEPQTERKPFIRIVINHVARRLPEDEQVYRRVTDAFGGMLKSHLTEKGYDWEFFIAETDRRLWMISGLYPPEPGSEGEKLWAAQNAPVEYERPE